MDQMKTGRKSHMLTQLKLAQMVVYMPLTSELIIYISMTGKHLKRPIHYELNLEMDPVIWNLIRRETGYMLLMNSVQQFLFIKN